MWIINWLRARQNQNRRQNEKALRKSHKRPPVRKLAGNIEGLEDRQVMASTVFLDFGIQMGTGLDTNVAELRKRSGRRAK